MDVKCNDDDYISFHSVVSFLPLPPAAVACCCHLPLPPAIAWAPIHASIHISPAACLPALSSFWNARPFTAAVPRAPPGMPPPLQLQPSAPAPAQCMPAVACCMPGCHPAPRCSASPTLAQSCMSPPLPPLPPLPTCAANVCKLVTRSGRRWNEPRGVPQCIFQFSYMFCQPGRFWGFPRVSAQRNSGYVLGMKGGHHHHV